MSDTRHPDLWNATTANVLSLHDEAEIIALVGNSYIYVVTDTSKRYRRRKKTNVKGFPEKHGRHLIHSNLVSVWVHERVLSE